jgi:hypothetical protein
MAQDQTTQETLEHRVATLRRHYGKGLGYRPTSLEEQSMWRAARLTAMAERAVSDPGMSVLDMCKLDARAEAARAEMSRLTAPKRRVVIGREPTLQDYVRSRAAKAQATA